MTHDVVQTITLTAILGTIGVLIGRRFKIPALLFYMLFGILAGPTVLGLINPSALGSLLMPLIELAVAVIIFEAGLGLPLSSFRSAPVAIRRMNTAALPITGLLATLAAHFVAGLPWSTAALFGAIIVVTGPTVIGPLLRSVALSPRVDSLLRWESVWVDCFGVLLAGVVFEGILHSEQLGFTLPGLFFWRLLIGVIVGASLGFLATRYLLPWTLRLGDPTLPGIVALTCAVGVFYTSGLLAENSGVVAAAVAGMMFTRNPVKDLESIKRFKDQITSLIIAFLFVFLSAQLDLTTVDAPWGSLVLTALIIVFVVRPLASWAALWRTNLLVNERMYIGLIGPRGIIAASVASYFGMLLAAPEYDSTRMVLLTFVTIFISASFVSLLGRPLARLIGVALAEYRTGIILIGYGPLVHELANILRSHVDVVVVDSDPFKCFQAKSANIESICESGMSDELYEDLMERGFRRALILTPNSALNNLMALKAKAHLGPQRVFTTSVATSEEDNLGLLDKADAFSPRKFDIGEINGLMQSGLATLVEMDVRKLPTDVRVEVLATLVESGGIRIKRAVGVAEGAGICLVFRGPNGVGEDAPQEPTEAARPGN